MRTSISYQFADSSLMKKKFGSSIQQDTNQLTPNEKLNETAIDSPSKTTLSIQSYSSIKKNETKELSNEPKILDLIDTANFGIKEEAITNLPTRKFKPVTSTKEEPKLLFSPLLKPHFVSNWETIILLICLLIVAITKGINQSKFLSIAKSIFSAQATYEIVRGEKVFFNRTNLLLNSVYILSSALYIYPYLTLSNSISNSSFEISTYLIILLSLGIFYSIKLLSNILINYFFDTSEIVLEYVYTTSLFNNIIGIIMLPILFILYFTSLQQSILFQNGIVLLIFSILLFRTIRFIKLVLKKNVFISHIFLYICTLEILPLIVIIKFFIA